MAALVTRDIKWSTALVDTGGYTYGLKPSQDVLDAIKGPGGVLACTFIWYVNGKLDVNSLWTQVSGGNQVGEYAGIRYFLVNVLRPFDTDAYNELKNTGSINVVQNAYARIVGGSGFCIEADASENALGLVTNAFVDFAPPEGFHGPTHGLNGDRSSLNTLLLYRNDDQGQLIQLRRKSDNGLVQQGAGTQLYYFTTQPLDAEARDNVLDALTYSGADGGAAVTFEIVGIDPAFRETYVPVVPDKTDCQINVFDILASLYVATLRYTYDDCINGLSDGTGKVLDTVIGASFADGYDLDSIVETICYVYGVERQFTANGVRFYKNRTDLDTIAIVASLEAAELAVTDTDSSSPRYALATNYQDTSSFVTQLALNFIDASNDYRTNQIAAKRPDALQTDPLKTVSLPFVMNVSDAEKLVNNLLTKGRLSLTTHTFRLPPKYIWIGKGDVVRINHGSFSDIMRITDTDVNADKSQSVTAETVASSVRNVPGVDYTPERNDTGGLVKSYPLVLDIPALNPVDETTGDGSAGMFEMYYGVTPAAVGTWLGAYFARQLKDDAWRTLFHAYGQVSKLGTVIYRATAQNALSDKRWVTDSDTLTVTADAVLWDTSQNTDKAGIDANPYTNLAVYGAPGRWELIQFEKIVDGVMSGIVRGLRGTENNCGLHFPGDRIFTLKPGLAMSRLPVSRLGEVAVYRAVSEGLQFVAQEQLQGQPFQGNSRRPFAPYHFAGSRDGSGDLTFSWVRRDRVRSGWGQAAPPQSEAVLAFTVNVCNSDGVLLRTLAATDVSVVYTAAMQSADQSTGLTEFQLQISQIGDIGPGFTGTEQVNV